MIARIKQIFQKGAWHVLALLIVMALAGPEILIGIELAGMIEALGAATFVMAYFNAFRFFAVDCLSKLKHVESSLFFVPTLNDMKEMPGMIFHLIPWYCLTSLFICYFLYVSLC